MKDIQTALKDLRLPAGYSIEYVGQDQQMNETFGQLGFALVIAIFLVYMVMAAQYESRL
jgi:HAE1 family hydrophobic/amphiphilic exporter-1